MPSCCSMPVNPDGLTTALPQAFARRLQELYGLQRAPENLEELISLRRGAGRIWSLPSAELLVSSTPTRHAVRLKDVRLYVHCALDALMYPLIMGQEQEAEIQSRCPICDHLIGAAVRDGEFISWTPESAMLWLGLSTEGGACCADESGFDAIKLSVCPFINLFDHPEHLEQWKTQNKRVMGVQLTLSQAFALAKGLCISAEEEASTRSQV